MAWNMNVERNFWRPDPYAARNASRLRPHSMLTCTTCENEGSETATTTFPAAFHRPTLVIWFSNTCSACRMSKQLFAALEHNGPRAGLDVVRVEATPAVMARFKHHVTSLPMYDFVFPAGGGGGALGAQPYGMPGVNVHTVRNNDIAELRRFVPDLSVRN